MMSTPRQPFHQFQGTKGYIASTPLAKVSIDHPEFKAAEERVKAETAALLANSAKGKRTKRSALPGAT